MINWADDVVDSVSDDSKMVNEQVSEDIEQGFTLVQKKKTDKIGVPVKNINSTVPRVRPHGKNYVEVIDYPGGKQRSSIRKIERVENDPYVSIDVQKNPNNIWIII
jgi:hypothetical protein